MNPFKKMNIYTPKLCKTNNTYKNIALQKINWHDRTCLGSELLATFLWNEYWYLETSKKAQEKT